MRMMIASRIFGIQIDGKNTDALVAYADMLNHKRPRQTSWYYCDDRKGFVIDSLTAIKRGEQIYDSYGKKCNSRFLLNYGFINLNNDANEYPYRVGLPNTDLQFKAKLDLLNGSSINRVYRCQADLREEVTQKLLSWLRLITFEHP